MVAFTKHDLQFILEGIEVSQTHADLTIELAVSASGNWNSQADIETSRQILLGLIPNSLEPIGMRTISGEFNVLTQGADQFGAVGNEFPRALDPVYSDDGGITGDGSGNPDDENGVDLNGPAPGGLMTNTDYAQSGNVVDSDPRIISNLIVDQSINNPAAIVRALNLAGFEGDLDVAIADVQAAGQALLLDPNDAAAQAVIDDYGVVLGLNGSIIIENTAPDEGLSAPFNSWMTLFGQFFDHGLDLVQKGGSGTVFIPLQPDDPLITLGRDGVAGTGDELTNPAQQFMVLTRATVDAGPDGILGTEDDVSDAQNFTSPFIDQNQTYTSHPSHQIFVREYELHEGEPAATGALIEGVNGGMANWGDVKAQAAAMLGIELTDVEAINIPLFAVDQYGEFVRGENGLPQFVMSDGSLFEGDLTDPVSVADAEAATGLTVQRTGFAFLLDISHDANLVDSQTGTILTRQEDGDANDGSVLAAGSYDGDLLDAHFIAGDGRANENFGLTAVHHVFHQEHNRMVEHTKEVLLSQDAVQSADLGSIGDEDGVQAALDLLNGYLIDPVATFPTTQPEIDALVWDGDRLFQAAKFATEMEYQHLVFEEFGRKVQPLIDIFASFEPSIDASIVAEFAHTVYRFGHSMLTESVDLMDADGNLTEAGLIEAFLNPLGFNAAVAADGTVTNVDIANFDASEAAGAIARAMTRQTGQEIDEFVTPALRSNLLGLPLDLAAINIARGRETGVPSLNEARAQFFAGTGDTKLKPYESWVDFALHSKDEYSVVNFIAAYGQHDVITRETDMAAKRANAWALVTGDLSDPNTTATAGEIADAADFLNSTGTWAGVESGLNLVDFWIGGLAESIEPFGGMLGSTFNFIFEEQMEDLQDGDRFYYLGRTAGLNFVTQLEQNSFANMIIRNTSIGDQGLLAEGGDGLGGDHLPGDIFSTPAYILEANQSRQITGLGVDGRADPTDGDTLFFTEVIRIDANNDGIAEVLRYTGGEHVVLGGTDLFGDTLIGGIGDDTLWGDGGDDTLEGGDGADILLGGDGDDIITDIGGANNIQGQGGNDYIFSGEGEDLILAGEGKDFVLMGPGLAETFAGQGDDFVHAGSESNIVFGGEGDDWLEGGGGNNLLQGDNGDPFLNSTVGGNDIFISGQGDDDYDSEGGDDIMEGADGIQRFEGLTGFDWATYYRQDQGVNVDMLLQAFDETPVPPSNTSIMDRFDSTEGLSGGDGSDILRGSDETVAEITNVDNGNDSVLRNFALIQGLRAGDAGGGAAGALIDSTALFDASVTAFDAGDIILGGAGSDIIEGRAGDDIIDGDLKLQVRLVVLDPVTGDPIATAFEMQGQLYAVETTFGTFRPALDAQGEMIPIDINGHQTLDIAIYNRAVNPGNVVAHREIIDVSNATDFDTAEFSGARANYAIETDINGDFGDGDGDGFITITDNTGVDGVDRVRGIERLLFADETIILDGANNNEPTGAPVVVDAVGNPVEVTHVGQILSVDISGIADLDGLTNAIFGFEWEFEETPGAGDFIPFELLNAAGEDTGLTGASIVVPPEAVGSALRVKAIFRDDGGVIETLFSAPTALVAPEGSAAATELADLLFGTAGADVIDGLGGNDQIFGFSGDDDLRGGPGNDLIEGGFGNDDIRGNGGLDTLRGQEGDDIIRGGGGRDTIEGGAGNDDIRAGGGNDTIIWNVGDGEDVVNGQANGGAGDLFVVNGDDTDEDFLIEADEINLAALVSRNGVLIATLTNIEDIEINAGAGANTLTVTGDFTGILSPNTITFNGGTGDDTIDVTGLTSATGLLIRTRGGQDTIVGALGPNDVIEVAPGLTPADFGAPVDNGDGTATFSTANGAQTITFTGSAANPPTLANDSTPDPTPEFALSQNDVAALSDLVNGVVNEVSENPLSTGVRDLEGTGNNGQSPNAGAADQPFIRITESRHGDFDAGIGDTGNNALNPIFEGLDPRDISNAIATQEAGLADQANGGTVFLMAFGQYFDHGLDFLPKGGSGEIGIGNDNAPEDNPADLTRGTVVGQDGDGATQHINKTSPFADQNQAYGSTELVGQFLRESDGNQGFGARLLEGAPDPSANGFNLMPTLAEVILHHWEANSLFFDAAKMGAPVAFQDAYPGLVDVNGDIDAAIAETLNADFMGSGHTLVGDRNPFIDLLDHVVAGDLRANENYMLTAIHTIWHRNHNFHVENLENNFFSGTPEELFQAAKIINEVEYQRVVFEEFADALIGGIQGDGDHGWEGYDPNATAAVSHEFAGAAFRIGHSLITQTIQIEDANGDLVDVPLTDVFLNPTNEGVAFPPGTPFAPAPGYAQNGVDNILTGIVTQPASEIDVNLVDAVRDDLVRIRADLASFNIARGRDLGLGTLNQVRADLLASTDPYVQEAVALSLTDLTPYVSWDDFQARNGLADAVIQQFQDAYPDLVLADAQAIADFQAVNPDINVTLNGDGTGTVAGVDRVDLWVGGLAESHINGGMVGATFWIILHEQFDRLQQADRFYYLDRADGFDFYEQIEGQTLADIITRNSGLDLTGTDVFLGAAEADDAVDGGDGVAVLTATNDNATIAEDGVATIDVLANDVDPDGGDISLTGVTAAANGTVTIDNNGTPADQTDDEIVYTPNADFTGVDSFNYTITNAAGELAAGTVTVTVAPVNDAPVAVDDAATTDEEVAVVIDVLANDSDVEGPVTIQSVGAAANGAVVDNGDGTVTYTPNANFSGADSFTYTIVDANGVTATATVNLTVDAAAPVAPVATDDAVTTDEDVAATINVLANDTDDGTISIDSVGAAANGTVVDNGDGTVTYTPDADFNGADSFTYTIIDGDGLTDTATVNVTVDPVNDAPVAGDDAAAATSGEATTIAVLGNDTDVDGDQLSVTGAVADSGGAVTVNPDGTLDYTPDAGFTGTETITYTLSDGTLTDEGAVTVTVSAPAPTAPVAVNDELVTDEDVAATINVLANDTDDGTISIDSVGAAANGTVVDNGDGTVTYTPDADFNGVDSFTYTIIDNDGLTDTATVNVIVDAVNDAPVAGDDAAAATSGEATTIAVLGNDTDVDGDQLSVTGAVTDSGGAVTVNPDGTLDYTPDAGFTGTETITYTLSDGSLTDEGAVTVTVSAPAPTGPTPFFASNGGVFDGTTGTAIIVPHASNMVIAEGAIELVANLADLNGRQGLFSKDSAGNDDGGHVAVLAQGNTLLVRLQDAAGDTNSTFAIQTGAVLTAGVDHHIALNFGPGGMELFVDGVSVGTNAYTGGLIGNQEPIVLGANQWTSGNQVADVIVDPLNGEISTANIYNRALTALEIAALAAGEPPVPVTPPTPADDAATVAEDASVLVDVLANDTDPNNEQLTLISAAGAANGTVTVENGQIRYTPNANFEGTDTFTYVVQNASGAQSTATATVTVTAVNDLPSALDDTANTLIGSPVDIDLLANDSDVEGPVSVDSFGQGANGSVTVTNGVATYTPNGGFTGTDGFTYTIIDSDGATATAAVVVDVTATPVGPTPVFSATNVTSDAFVIEANQAAFQMPDGAIEVAFNLDALSNGRQALFSKDSSGNGDGGHVLAYVQNDDLRVRLQSDSGQVELTVTDQITAGQNHHVVVNFGSNGFEVFLDGDLLAFDQAWLQGMENNAEDWVIGGNAWLTQPGSNNPIVDTIDGSILEFSLFDRDLTDQEVADQAADYLIG